MLKISSGARGINKFRDFVCNGCKSANQTNEDGTALCMAVAAIFIAQLNGVEMSFLRVISVKRNAIVAKREMNEILGDDTVAEGTARKWLAMFKAAENSPEDQSSSGHPQKVSLILHCHVGSNGFSRSTAGRLILVLTSMGLPIKDVSLLLLADRILDRVRELINVVGNAFGAVIINHHVKKDLLAYDLLHANDFNLNGKANWRYEAKETGGISCDKKAKQIDSAKLKNAPSMATIAKESSANVETVVEMPAIVKNAANAETSVRNDGHCNKFSKPETLVVMPATVANSANGETCVEIPATATELTNAETSVEFPTTVADSTNTETLLNFRQL
ncbi:hypothetical protein KIN20_020979 [Parelaphostrongylus tenuis]|uniref:Amino acid transporter n=1 Tax=Parelaphostrongylus tenuis TaxID=148309 RepID=A0AAD5MS12_PARTN|nr:hypothetical protein KIN20_020979 [Parelaphostrongylus tenuis]